MAVHVDHAPCHQATGCPTILAALIAVTEITAPNASGDLLEQLEVLTGERKQSDPDAQTWRHRYHVELQSHPSLAFRLQQSVAKALHRVALTALEREALTFALHGVSVQTIARLMKIRRTRVDDLLWSATDAVRSMLAPTE